MALYYFLVFHGADFTLVGGMSVTCQPKFKQHRQETDVEGLDDVEFQAALAREEEIRKNISTTATHTLQTSEGSNKSAFTEINPIPSNIKDSPSIPERNVHQKVGEGLLQWGYPITLST